VGAVLAANSILPVLKRLLLTRIHKRAIRAPREHLLECLGQCPTGPQGKRRISIFSTEAARSASRSSAGDRIIRIEHRGDPRRPWHGSFGGQTLEASSAPVEMPVTLPPASQLETKPLPTGSPTRGHDDRNLLVAWMAERAQGVVQGHDDVGRAATSSAASAGRRSSSRLPIATASQIRAFLVTEQTQSFEEVG